MKRFSSLILAAVLGGALALGGYALLTDVTSQSEGLPDNLLHSVGTTRTLLPGGSADVDFTVAAERVMPTVVQIKAQESDALAQQRRQQERRSDPWSRFFDFDFGNDLLNPFGFRPREGAGSGVIISEDGYIVTNNHVVDFADKVYIKTFDGEEYEAQIVGRDPSTDLAVLKIEGDDFPAIEFGDSDRARIGEWVLAVGNPFEYLTSTVTAGIISAKGRDINLIRGEKTIEEFIQTDAAINPGNSGGALVDAQGRLIGINTAIASYTGNYAGYSFAIPVNLMSKIVNDIIESGGVLERTSLGVYVEALDEAFAKELGIDRTEGLVVMELVDGGAAQYGGVLPYDVIVAVDGKEISKFEDLERIINLSKVGDTLKIKVLRKGEYRELPVRLRKRM
ncbi:MAG: trypsin-like peptidase domain-containing protein [Saprospiraceae bacterium]|nr:trypsin-like peptidase domain-containing protein [Saprospiraceae bacterium]